VRLRLEPGQGAQIARLARLNPPSLPPRRARFQGITPQGAARAAVLARLFLYPS
jgi:hypothetical protein